MSDVTDLSAKRWDEHMDPAKHKPVEALHAALRYIEEEGMPDHIMVLFGRRDVEHDCDGTKFFQAGDYYYHAQMGLLFESQQMIRDSGRVD